MNKYYIKIPYNYMRYGHLSCYVYAEDEEEAMDLAYECENRHSEDYDDSDDSGDTEMQFSEMEIELESEDENPPHGGNNNSNTPFSNIPDYFLAEIAKL